MPVSEAFERLLALHDRIGSPLRRYLRPPLLEPALHERLAEVGLVPPSELVELYGLHDGVDEEAWNREQPGTWFPDLVHGGPRFLGCAAAMQRCRELRERDAVLAATPLWELEPGSLWRPAWLPVFPLMRSDENVAVDCDPSSGDFGRVRAVRWEATENHVVADSVSEFLGDVADRFEAVDTRWDETDRVLRDDETLAEQLGSFP